MSFFSFVLYLFCIFIRPQDWVSPVVAWPLVNILAVATIIFLFLESSGKPAGFRFVSGPQSGLITVFFLSIFLSHIAHTYFFGLQDAFFKFYPTYILFFVMLNALNSPRRLKQAVWFMILLIAVIVWQGVYQAENGFGWAGQPLTVQRDGDNGVISRINWVGIFSDPNDLALLFVMGVGLLLPFVFARVNFFMWVFSTALAAFMGYGIFLANSRGGQVAFLVTVFYFFVRKTRKFVLGGVLGGLAGVALVALGPSRMGSLSSSEDSASARLDLWYGGLQLFKSNPFFGRGYHMFMEDLPQTAHNSYILAAAELGFLGLFCWVALIYISIKGLLMVQNRSKTLGDYALGVQTALIGFSAAAFFLSRTYVILPYVLFALAGSIVWLAALEDRDLRLRFDFRDFCNVVLICLGVLLTVVLMIRGR